MTCPDCATATQVEHHGFSANCQGCVCRGLARIFLRREERGTRFKRACAQHNVTPDDVRRAWADDHVSKETT